MKVGRTRGCVVLRQRDYPEPIGNATGQAFSDRYGSQKQPVIGKRRQIDFR
jgi:hypothetical protein